MSERPPVRPRRQQEPRPRHLASVDALAVRRSARRTTRSCALAYRESSPRVS